MRGSMFVFIALSVIPVLMTIVMIYTKTIDFKYLALLWAVPVFLGIIAEIAVGKPSEQQMLEGVK